MATRRLVVQSGLAKGQAVDLTQGAISVGRADENNIVLEDNSISRRHVTLIFDGAEYKLRDVGSRNGTRVNNKPVLETKLVPGDVIQLGEVDIRYEAIGSTIITPPGAAPADAARVKQLQTQLEQLTAQNRDLTTKISTAEQQLVEAQKRAAERGAAELTKSDADLAKVRAELDEARKAAAQVQALQAERQALSAQLATAQKQVEEAAVVRSQVQTLALEKQQLQKQLENANLQITQERTQAAERESSIRSELQRATTELASTKEELTAAKQLATRVEELTTQNRALETRLAGAQKDLNTAWQDIAVARQRMAVLEKSGAGSAETQVELSKLRTELEQARQAASRVQELSGERERLAAQLTGVEQQMIQAREQAQREAAQAKAAQEELAKARRQIEAAKKETAKIVITPRGVAKPPAPAEDKRLVTELAEAQARLKEVSVELTKTKAELDHLRLSPAKPKTEVALKPALPAPQGDRRQALEEQIAGLEKKIVEAGRQSPGAETEEIRKWKSELAVARASLYNLVMEAQRRAPKPAQAPVAEPQPVPLAESPRRKTSLAALAALTLAAVAVFGLVVWLYQKWSEPVPSPVVAITPVKPAIEPKVIVDPVVPPKPDASEYRDAQGRFTCWLPTGWNVAEQTAAADESRLRLVNGKDAITVVVSGTDWPALVKTDQPQVEAAFAQRLKIAYPDGLFGQLVGTTLQMMDGEPAMLMEYTITLRDSISVVKALEYRKAGRAHLIELHANSREQATLLAGVFDKFLSRYHSGTDASN